MIAAVASARGELIAGAATVPATLARHFAASSMNVWSLARIRGGPVAALAAEPSGRFVPVQESGDTAPAQPRLHLEHQGPRGHYDHRGPDRGQQEWAQYPKRSTDQNRDQQH